MNQLSRISLILFLIIVSSCDRGGNILMVGSIKGPDEVSEGTTVEFSVEAEGDSGITFNWVVNPVGYGILGSPTASSTTFTAPDVDSDFEIVIRVVVNSDNDGPVVRSIDVTVMDVADPPDPQVNQPPTAGAYVTTSVVEQDIEIQFFDDSTDPNGNDDIVTWEWDFTYDPDDGLIVENSDKEPVMDFPEPGIFVVQLRVTDSGGLTDMLDESIQITVIPGRPVTFYGFTFGGEDRLEGAIGIGVDPFGNVYVAGETGDDPFDIDPGDGIYILNPDDDSAYIIKYGQPDFHVIDVDYWEHDRIRKFTGDKNGNFYITGDFSNGYRQDGAYIRSITPTNLNNWEVMKENYYWEHPWNPGFVWSSKTYMFSPVACGDHGDIFFTEACIDGDYELGVLYYFDVFKGTTTTDPDDFLNLRGNYPATIDRNSIGVGSHGLLVLMDDSSTTSELVHFSLDGTKQWEIQISHQPKFLYTSIKSDADGIYYVLRINDQNVTCIFPDGNFNWELQWDA
ncbi:SBBP repeat-containing protein, partial [bacterium]|nr:SBBP repeat-containing protein [bacterium]